MKGGGCSGLQYSMEWSEKSRERDKVFEKFYSLARPHSKRKSTGLGLAFVKEIAAQHRGRIELANAKGGGALATLALPLAAR